MKSSIYKNTKSSVLSTLVKADDFLKWLHTVSHCEIQSPLSVVKVWDCCLGNIFLDRFFSARLPCFSEAWLSTAPNVDIVVLTVHWEIKNTNCR